MDLSTLTVIVGLVIGLGGIGSTVVFLSQVRGQRTSVEFLQLANQGLRDALADNEKKCAAEIAELRGQIHVMQSGIVERVAERVGERVGDRIVAALKAGES